MKMPVHRATAGGLQMELIFGNGWNGNGWVLDRLASFRQGVEAATDPHDPHALLRADVTEYKDAYRFYLEMPGLKGDSIDVEVEGDSLVVTAERSRPDQPQGTQVHIAERRYGPIKRVFALPLNARRDGIRAAYTDGVLELTVEKRAESKPIKVQVN
jgi:HSP20 family molecular chaperone IbpA